MTIAIIFLLIAVVLFIKRRSIPYRLPEGYEIEKIKTYWHGLEDVTAYIAWHGDFQLGTFKKRADAVMAIKKSVKLIDFHMKKYNNAKKSH